MRKGPRFVLLLFFLTPIAGFSQLLKGRVLNERGELATGVKVHFKNKTGATSTNADGSFKITATKLPDTLVFSAAGFETYQVIINEKNINDPHFEVVLLNTRETLEEVVVTGYGTARKKDITKVSAAGDFDGDGVVDKLEAERRSYDGRSASTGAAPELKIRGNSSGARPFLFYSKKTSSVKGEAGSAFLSDGSIAPREGTLAKSRILTAGEVNDFNKWKMWGDYSDNEFKISSEQWGMSTNKRFSVQLTDKSHNAIINEPLYLISKTTKDTVWRAYTDNTGKAELWAGFLKNNIEKEEYFIADSYGNIINSPSEFTNGINLLKSGKSCGFSNDVDIAFVVDATGSMGDEIEFLKLELEDVIRGTMEKYPSLNLNAASVFYRDKGDAYLTKKVDFNEDLLKTINFIKLQNSGGGGDHPEAADEALATALDSLEWRKNTRTKLLFLVLDAPCHDDAKERIRMLTLKAAAMGVRIIPLACSGTDKSTEFLLRSMALATNGTYAFLTDHSGVGYSHIEPTTDKYDVELLNGLLQRIIGQFLYTKDCAVEDAKQINPLDTRQPENILSIKIYPNPTSGRFTIESKKDIKEIFVADFTGKIIMRLPVADKKGNWQVDIGQYPSGVYLVKYITSDNKWGAEKIVLVH